MKISDPQFINILSCPLCQNDLHDRKDNMACEQCGMSYPIRTSAIYLAPKGDQLLRQYREEARSPINRFKALIKTWPWLFDILTLAIGSVSFFGQSAKTTIKKTYGNNTQDKIIINIGSGISRPHPAALNLDIFPFKNVDIVASATALPFKDNSVDMIISESTLEHIPDGETAIKEIMRTVKPGGMVYITIPFLMPFHASPNDYMRLTHEGLKQKFSAFEPIKIGMRGGPASALITFLMYFFALPFSLISESAYNFATYFFMVILSPLRIFDLLFFLFPKSIETATIIYFVGKKKNI
ncbi:MAG: methyltransferase domain-containing protein [Candidatus Niyogibacteria bacterium]|nr:methyltransferase domain-containing protein [Candidatus Niyogibacteria bacterium]